MGIRGVCLDVLGEEALGGGNIAGAKLELGELGKIGGWEREGVTGVVTVVGGHEGRAGHARRGEARRVGGVARGGMAVEGRLASER